MSTQNTQAIAKKEQDITVKVLNKINTFRESGELTLPKDYSPENALKSAYLELSELKDKNGKPVLESCTPTSIATSLLSMVTWGLSPIKKQVYFIPYGDKLQISKSYLGNIAIAKRVANVKDINAQVVFKGDDFSFKIDANTGTSMIEYHRQTLESIDSNEIIGAYAIVIFEDGSKKVDVMTSAQIKRSWEQGATKGNSPAHQKFQGEMMKKTVINRLLKTIIGGSSDSGLYEEKEPVTTEEQVAEVITEKANVEYIDFEEETTKPTPEVKTEVKEVKEEPKSNKPIAPNELFDEKEEAGF